MVFKPYNVMENILSQDYVKQRIKLVLDRSHNVPQKREIKEYTGRLNFACPVCGDSHDYRKKRGNVWYDTMWYKCFNCDASMSFTRLMDRFGVDLDIDVRMNISNMTADFRKMRENASLPDTMVWCHSLKKLIRKSNQGDIVLQDIKPLQQGGKCWDYINKRRIPPNMREDIYQGVMRKNKKTGGFWYEPVIIALNRRKDELLGLQVRNLQQGNFRQFNTYSWTTINNELLHSAEATQEEMISYDMLSGIFGITKVNPEQPITVFEGYFDSLFVDNSIAIMGTGRDEFVQPLIDSGLNLRFFFDNDETGRKKADKWLQLGYPVFQWSNWISYMSKRSKDPIKVKHGLSQLKDMNDLALAFKDPWNFGKMDQYFVGDALDAMLL